MFELIVNVLFGLGCLGFILLVLVELGRSQKSSEMYHEVPNMLRLTLDLKNLQGNGWQTVIHHAETLGELQELANSFAMFRIMRAGVWNGTTMTHVMNPVGVLEAV